MRRLSSAEKVAVLADWKRHYDALVYADITRRQEMALAQRCEPEIMALTEPLIERETQRYMDDLLELDEFELRVDGILHGVPCWWEG